MKTALVSALLVGAGASTFSAISGQKSAKKGIKAQEKAQEESLMQAAKDKRASDQAINAARKKQPNVAALLADAQKGFARVPKTRLTGETGLPTSNLLGM